MSSERFDPDHQPSLLEAQEWLLANRREGVICPCCHQYAKEYRRKIHAGMARDLIRLYRAGGWDGPARLLRKDNNSDLGKLRYWGLIEPTDDAGTYLITTAGYVFVRGWSAVPKHALVYNGRCLGLDDQEKTTIREALGDKFDYDELMRA